MLLGVSNPNDTGLNKFNCEVAEGSHGKENTVAELGVKILRSLWEVTAKVFDNEKDRKLLTASFSEHAILCLNCD
jgi:hypothetical protein